MTHIALLIPHLAKGGAERVVIETARGMAERRHEVDIVLIRPVLAAYRNELPRAVRLIVLHERPAETDFPEQTLWQPEHVSCARLATLAPSVVSRTRVAATVLLRRSGPKRVLRLARYFDREKPDIVFANNPQAEYTGYLAARIASSPPPIIPVMHGAEPADGKEAKRRRLVWSGEHPKVAVSKGAAEHLSAVFGVPESEITVIYNPAGMALEYGEQATAIPDHPWFTDDGPPIVLGAGRLSPLKGFRTLIDAVARVRKLHPCRLVILGEGRERDALLRRAADLGLQDAVSLPGWVDNPFSYMARASLFVLSSEREGFGNVLVEAMACGCPAVATDCPGGPPEILEDPDLLAPVGDPEALARVMLRALSRSREPDTWRARAARFSLDQTVDGYEDLIRRTLGVTKPGPLDEEPFEPMPGLRCEVAPENRTGR